MFYRLLFIIVVLIGVIWGLLADPPDYDHCHTPATGGMICEEPPP